MNLRELFESTQGIDAAFCFGRFNPAHQGHVAVWKAVEKTSANWYVGTNPNTHGPKDPLPFNVKSAWMTAIYPKLKNHIAPETSVVTLAAKIFADLGQNENSSIAYVTDAADWEWSGKLLNDYNGKEGQHGYYKFAKIIHIPSPRVSSATALRDAARADDERAFYHASGTNPGLTVGGHHYFETVREYCHANPEKVKKPKKEKVAIEDAAGVGIITKQNSTCDVDASTPRKNLKAFNLVKEANKAIREIRAKLSETKPDGKMHPHAVDAGQGAMRMRDVGGYDRTYHLNRIWMATAMADGKSKKPVDMDSASFVEKYNVAFPYTDIEHMMVLQAMATVPTDGKELTKRSKSKEPDDTNKTSAVAKPKRNKYGI
jgi:hypothetical protein